MSAWAADGQAKTATSATGAAMDSKRRRGIDIRISIVPFLHVSGSAKHPHSWRRSVGQARTTSQAAIRAFDLLLVFAVIECNSVARSWEPPPRFDALRLAACDGPVRAAAVSAGGRPCAFAATSALAGAIQFLYANINHLGQQLAGA